MEWISVKDRLPKRPPNRTDENGREWFTVTDSFIVTDSEGRVFEACYSYANKSFWYGNSLNEIEVVAYMPLPKPYKTKKITMTNYEKIKSMSIEEMAASPIPFFTCPYDTPYMGCDMGKKFDDDCIKCTKAWLESEVQE